MIGKITKKRYDREVANNRNNELKIHDKFIRGVN